MVPGGLLMGLGIGKLLGYPGAGLFIGLGAAFVIISIFSLFTSKDEQTRKQEDDDLEL